METKDSKRIEVVRLTTKRRSARPSRRTKSLQKPPPPTSATAVYVEEWEVKFARDFDFWRFDVGYFLQENLLQEFLKRLKQVQLLTFFEKTCEIIAPRQLIVDFILRCEVRKAPNVNRQVQYDLQIRHVPPLRIELTRESFADILQLPVVEGGSELPENLSSKCGEEVKWLGEEYLGSLCTCLNCKQFTGPEGYWNCGVCSSGAPESFWLTNEIKDPSIRDLIHFLGTWIHNLNDTSCLRKAAVCSLNEALISEAGKQIWTQHLWDNFLLDLENMRSHAEQSKPYECHFSTAGLISTVICENIRKSYSWIPALQVWQSSTFSPGMKTCKLLLKQVRKSEGDGQGAYEEALQVYQRRTKKFKVYNRRCQPDANKS